MSTRWVCPLRWLAAAGLAALLTTIAVASNDSEQRFLPNPNKAAVETAPMQGTARGKYRVLLRKIYVPQDAPSYGKFTDYGMYTGNSWAGFNDLPPGYWVYENQHWYIWRDCVKPDLVVPHVPLVQPGTEERPGKADIPDVKDGAKAQKILEDLQKK